MLAFYWMFSSSSAFQLRENTGSWELKSAFGCCRFEYVKMMHGDASLWESFPRALERQTGARRYVGAFRAPFQDLRLTPSQEHAVRVCSLLAIPPPPLDQKALPGGVSEDLSEDNLSTWADTVQDVVVGMIVPQPGTDQTIFPQLVELLTLLESVSRMAFCRQCYLPGSTCRCLESSSTATTASTTGLLWSDIADPTFGTNPAPAGRGAGSALPYGSSSMAGGSIWDLPSTDFPGLPGAPSAICQPRPPAGRASHLESQLMAIRYGLTAPPDPLGLPQPTWTPPTTQNRQRVQLPPPPPRTDSVSTTDQSQQTTAPDPGPEGQGTRQPGRARVRGHHHGPVSPPPRQPQTSQQASGRSGGTSRRAPDWNPLANLANHRSGGWKKDLDFYMGAYFRLNYRQEPASKWPELKAKFFNFLIDHHSEWKSIRNNDPLGYLPYMEVQFKWVTGYKLVGLGACTEWIRAGTYYHWVIAQRGQLGRCPRLAGIPPPEGPMMPPPYPPVTAAAPPATAAPAAPAAPPVTAAPPATAVASTQATIPDPPQGGGGRPRAKSQPQKRDAAAAGVQGAARDTGGAGDSSGRSGRATSREPRTARSCSKKRRRSQSRRRDSRPMAPFPLQDQEGRLQALQTLYEEAGEHKLASEITALRGLQVSHPEMGAEELQRLNNQVLLMIAEYHLTSASQGTHRVLPVLPEGAARLMPPVDEYLPGSFEGCRDVRVTDRAQILRIATWLHRLDLAATYGAEIATSPQVEDYDFGPLLEYFLMPRLTTVTLQEVAARVAQENRRDLETSLRDLHDERDSLQKGIELLTAALDNEQQRERKKTIKKQLDSRRRELRSNQRRISRVEGLLGLEQPQQPPTAQGSLDVIVEETTETTVMTDEESESEATPLGGPTDEATTPVRETEQDMETEGEGGNSPVTPNEDDLLMGAGAADVETGIASLHVDSPAKPRGDDDAAT